MKLKKQTHIIALMLILLFLSSPVSPYLTSYAIDNHTIQINQINQVNQDTTTLPFVAHQIYLRYQDGLSDELIQADIARYKITLSTFEFSTPLYFKVSKHYDLIPELYLLDITDQNGNPVFLTTKAMHTLYTALKDNPLIHYSQPNFKYTYTPAIRPILDDFDKLWAFENTGKVYRSEHGDVAVTGTAGVDINLLKAWDITRGDKNVIVMVADDGVDSNHIEFIDRIIQNNNLNPLTDYIGQTWLNNDGDNEIKGAHGTHVAGTIAASWDTGKIVGVAPLTTLLPMNIMSNPQEEAIHLLYGTSDLAIASILVAKQYGVKVINNSWGSQRWELDETTDEKILVDDWEYDRVLRELIKSVESTILYVVAAGNEGHDNDIYPSSPDMFGRELVTNTGEKLPPLTNVISVAAMDNRGQLTSYTNFGKNTVHIAAPGFSIYSTLPSNSYGTYDGTSMAAPMVSGTAALMYSVAPNLNPQQVIKILMDTGQPLVHATDLGKTKTDKFIDAYAAVTAAKATSDEAYLQKVLLGVSPWAKAGVEEAFTKNLTRAELMSDFTKPITRLEFARLITQLYEAITGTVLPTPTLSAFRDTSDRSVNQAYQLGIVAGKGDNFYAPNDTITRQEIAVMFYRTLRAIDPQLTATTYPLTFNDQALIDVWAKTEVATMNHYQVVQGVGQNTFNPLGIASREQAFLLVLRTFNLF